MRNLLTLVFILFISSSYAAPAIKLTKSKGKWDLTSNWDLGRLPQNGDTIVIPASDTLVVDQNLNLSSATFVIQVYGALFFQGGGAKLIIDGNSIVKVYKEGIIYSTSSPSQVLVIGGITKFSGNGTSITGPAVASNLTSSGFAPLMEGPVILPVKFIGFTVTRNNGDVLVQWATAQEVNAAIYEVQRSTDGANWNSIGTVRAAGNTTTVTNYSFTDNHANHGTAYYRIKQVDLDTHFEYTAVRTVKADALNATISAAGARGTIVLQFPVKARGQVEVCLISLSGQVVSRQTINQPVGQLVIPASVKGNYIVTVADQQEIQVSKQILL